MPNLHNVIDDIKEEMFPNGEIKFTVEQRDYRRWVVYVYIRYSRRSAKLEFIINQDVNNPDDTEVFGSVLRNGSVSNRTITLIMDSIIERL